MAINITVGSVTVTINPAALSRPVVPHPSNQVAVHSAFEESLNMSGLAAEVFDALPVTVRMADPVNADIQWPDRYGTTEEPWGRPDEPGTGVREIRCDDDGSWNWTDTINQVAKARHSLLKQQAELAYAIAEGIKAGIESTFRTGRVQLTLGIATVTNVAVTANTEIFLSRLGSSGDASLKVNSVTIGSHGGFVIHSSDDNDAAQVSWMLVG